MENNLTPYDQFQLRVYGNIIPAVEETPDDELFESGIEELNRLAEWMESMAEAELLEHQ